MKKRLFYNVKKTKRQILKTILMTSIITIILSTIVIYNEIKCDTVVCMKEDNHKNFEFKNEDRVFIKNISFEHITNQQTFNSTKNNYIAKLGTSEIDVYTYSNDLSLDEEISKYEKENNVNLNKEVELLKNNKFTNLNFNMNDFTYKVKIFEEKEYIYVFVLKSKNKVSNDDLESYNNLIDSIRFSNTLILNYNDDYFYIPIVNGGYFQSSKNEENSLGTLFLDENNIINIYVNDKNKITNNSYVYDNYKNLFILNKNNNIITDEILKMNDFIYLKNKLKP